jgi:site-specific recombinase XerD
VIKDSFAPKEISIDELTALISEFLSQEKFSSSTYKTYKTGLSHFITYCRSEKFQFLVEDVNSYIDSLQAKAISPAAIHSYLTALRNFFSFLAEKKAINKNPAKRITFKYIKSKQAVVKLLPEYIDILFKIDFQNDFLNARNRAILYLVSTLDFNVNDLCRLKKKDVYFYGGIVHCRKGGKAVFKITGKELGFLLNYLKLRSKFDNNQNFFISLRKDTAVSLTSNAANKILAAYAKEASYLSNQKIKPSSLKQFSFSD